MDEMLSVAIPCRASEPGLRETLESVRAACLHPQLSIGIVQELLICINGIRRGDNCPPLHAVRQFCRDHRIECEEVWVGTPGQPEASRTTAENGNGESEKRRIGAFETKKGGNVAHSPIHPFAHSFPRCIVLLTERKGKPPAWNTLWQRACGTLVAFADADVRIDPEAVWALYARLQHEPTLQLVAAREVPVIPDASTLWSRMGAIPYRFNFGNAGGRLLMLRKTALTVVMPDNLLLEDAWLTVAVGRKHVAKEIAARVFFVPPVTWSDYFAERVRTEGGKIQIAQEHGAFLAEGPVAAYHWGQFWRGLSLRDYPLVVLAQLVKIVARVWARLRVTQRDFYSLYRPYTSTKEWGRGRE